jgi:tetrahydromethanopterin S-methyltransferase subunit E
LDSRSVGGLIVFFSSFFSFFFCSINETSGEISVQQSLQNLAVHVITGRVEARDKNAAKNIEAQIDIGT